MSPFFLSRVAAATAFAAVFLAPSQADAQGRTEYGVGPNGLAWEATSRIVGVNSTGTLASGGDPRHMVPDGTAGGVVGLLMTYDNGQQFVCSGSLLSDRRSILTAAHCVSDGGGVKSQGLVRTQVLFRNASTSGDATQIWADAGATSVDVTNYFVQADYTGSVIDHNDVAVLRLGEAAPDFANSFELFEPAGVSGLTGEEFNVMGYGGRSNGGGAVGTNLGTGRLRQGDNMYDFRAGQAEFGNAWYGILGPQSRTEFSYLSDFDNGLAANDATCRVLQAGNFNGMNPADRTKFCDLGLGLDEVSVAGGDSGGPQFVNGMLASVTSYGLTFGPNFGDFDDALNSSFGEFNGFVPTYIHANFIRGNMVATVVPEPTSVALMGFGLAALGAVARRRRNKA